jgi:hypothetical protein
MSILWDDELNRWRFECNYCGDGEHFERLVQALSGGWTGEGVGRNAEHECPDCSRRQAA